MLSAPKSGYDVSYLTKATGGGAGYYLSASGGGGEPPGQWAGQGAKDLGLTGEVNPDVMRALYHHDEAPGGSLDVRGRKSRYEGMRERLEDRIADAVAEKLAGRLLPPAPGELKEIERRERARLRNSVPFFDMTYSAPKSVSVLHASYLAAAASAEEAGESARAAEYRRRANAIEDAARAAARLVVARIEQNAAFVRTGYHSQNTGEWRDARGITAALFLQHTSRDGDPQLHVHIAILNRAQRADGEDYRHRTLDGRSLFRERLGIAAIADRMLEQDLLRQGFRLVQREDGNGLEVGGVSQATMEAFSSRRTTITPALAALVAEYEAVHGHAPSRRALWSMRQHVTLKTRRAKPESAPDPAAQLHAWEEKSECAEVQALADVQTAVQIFRATTAEPAHLTAVQRSRAIRVAVAEVQRQNAAWTASQLLWELNRALPPLAPGTDPATLLEGMLADALTGRADGTEVVRIAGAPDAADVSDLGVRASDGGSVYRPPGEARYTTADMLDAEEYLLRSAAAPVRQMVTDAEAQKRINRTDLDPAQAEVARGLLTTRTAVTVLVAPAGTGKSHVMAAYARAYIAATGRRVIGLTASTNAAEVLANEGLAESYNVAEFLGKIRGSDRLRRPIPLRAGDVLVIDEATQVSTADMVLLQAAAAEADARIIETGDTHQLGSVDAGGMFRLIAAEQGFYRLREVRRFREKWERDASVRLRTGDAAAIGAYDTRGRIRSGPADVMQAKAVSMWLADFLAGTDTLLLAGSNEEAADLARLARERLIELGRVEEHGRVRLADGNEAGTGDMVRARLNVKADAGGRPLKNRDTLRIENWTAAGAAIVTRQLHGGGWSERFAVPAAYLRESAELDYAGNVHVAEGRTLHTGSGHLLTSETLTREGLYVGATRSRVSNALYVVTGPAMQQQAKGDPPELAPPEAVLASIMGREDADLTATEVMREAQDWAGGTRHMHHLWAQYIREETYPAVDAGLKARLPEREYARYEKDPARMALQKSIREAQLAGADVGDLLDQITREGYEGARSVARVLHGRLAKAEQPAGGQTVTWAERTPAAARPAAREIAEAMDARQRELGEAAAQQPPIWALKYLGTPPREAGALQEDWIARVGLVASYREAAGHDDPREAVGPAPRNQPELHEAHAAAMRALEMQAEEADVRSASDGELEARVQEHGRALAWAPPEVSEELRAAAQAQADARAQEEEARARGAHELARGAAALAEVAEERRAALADVHAVYEEWEAHTAPKLEAAEQAAGELQRRDPDYAPETQAPEPGAEQQQEPGSGGLNEMTARAVQAAGRIAAEREESRAAEQEYSAEREYEAQAAEAESSAWQPGRVQPDRETEEAEV